MRVDGSPGSSGHHAYAFGPFVADTVTRRLWREGRPVPITAKTFDVLAVLLAHRDGPVTKDELLDRVWPDTAVQENNLARQISSLRRALGQRRDDADYVLTISGHGYRFVADVEEVQQLPAAWHESHALPRPVPADSTAGRASAFPIGPRWFAALAGAAVLLVAVGAGTTWLRRDDTDPQTRRTLQRVTFDDDGLSRDASWSPDGRWLVFVSDRGGTTDLWKQRIGDPDPVRLTTSEASESQPDWSPDGRAIVFRSERDGGGLYVIPADGGPERRIAGFGYEPRWSPDATRILFKGSVILPDLPTTYVVRVDGTPPQPLRPEILTQFTSLQAAWHPDGRRVSIWGVRQDGGTAFVNVPVDSGGATTPAMSETVRRNLSGITVRRFVWARSRRHIYLEGLAADTRNVWRLTADPSTDQLIDGPVRLTTGTGPETNVAVSPDGERILFTSSTDRTRLWAFPLDHTAGRIAGTPLPITRGTTAEVDFDARQDGSTVTYRAVRAGRNELWERSLADGRERLLLSSADWLMKPRWSPDGTRLAFLRCGHGGSAAVLSVLNADGSGERALTTPTGVEMQASDWSRSGESVLGSCRFSPADRYSTCVMPVSSGANAGHVQVIASDPTRSLFNQRYSPNQRWIAVLAHDLMHASTSTVYVIPAAGGAWRAMTDGATFDDKPHWGPDGRVLYYVSDRDGVKNVWGRRFDDERGVPVGEPFAVTSFRSPQFLIAAPSAQMDIAITATHLLIPMSESRGDIWMLDQVDR